MLRTVTTLHAIACHNAPTAMKNSVAQLRHTLLLKRKREDCSRWADLATEGAVIEAIPLIISHYGLHNTLQAILHNGRLQDVRGALAYAQVARRTLRLQMLYTLRTRRCYGAWSTMFATLALHSLLHTLVALLRLGNGDSGYSGNGSDKVSARLIGRFLCGFLSRGRATHRKRYCPLRAGVYAVETYHTARGVDAMRSGIYTLALSLATTQAAIHALRGIYLNLKE